MLKQAKIVALNLFYTSQDKQMVNKEEHGWKQTQQSWHMKCVKDLVIWGELCDVKSLSIHK